MSRNDLAGSHIPLLIKALYRTTGPVLELGMGWNSTPILHWMCADMGRKLVSVEGNKEWADKFNDYRSDSHEIRVVDNWDYAIDDDRTWGLVLVDHRPDFRRRIEASKLVDRAGIILLHDSEPGMDKHYKYSTLYPKFKYVYKFTGLFPHTAAVSNYQDVSEELI